MPPAQCASEAAGWLRTDLASEVSMRRTGTGELPGARRAWMGPPLAALGLTLPRIAAAPSRTAALQPVKPPPRRVGSSPGARASIAAAVYHGATQHDLSRWSGT